MRAPGLAGESVHAEALRAFAEGRSPEAPLFAHWEDALGLPSPGQLKLLSATCEGGASSAALEDALARARRLNDGRLLCFREGGCLLALCFAEDGDSQLSHRRLRSEVLRVFGSDGPFLVSSSQIFERLEDLDLAYRQTQVCHVARAAILREPGYRYDEQASALITFEDCLLYYLLGSPEHDRRFLSFCFSHSLPQKLRAEDARRGTCDFELFWQYLSCERNATMVGERMHMHRNTVIYRMEKLQRRFDLDLSSPEVREKMLIDYKAFSMMESHLLGEAGLRELP